ncbi:MerR family transcriptional regulator [Actinokineospora sp. HUAS TT18]|uniref:MerR family transcriptional regulator n=1 Tax=Actinokineospora sp. HUAS TT18 TaxID=3447451 RepID=UPI003F51C3FE
MHEDRMMIGDFARRSRLSPKALRLYDSMGLLSPSDVDPGTGYRYYRSDQFHRARRIVMMRGIGMSLARIRDVLDLDPADAAAEVEADWARREAEHDSQRGLVRLLLTTLTGGESDMYDVKIRDVPAQRVLAVTRNTLADALPCHIAEDMKRLFAHLEASGATVSGPPLAIYHGEVSMDSDGPMEVAVPFTGDVAPVGDLVVREEVGHREAFVTITKGQVVYPKIIEVYAAVEAWLSTQSLTASGSPREVYFADWAAIGDQDPAADIAFPC